MLTEHGTSEQLAGINRETAWDGAAARARGELGRMIRGIDGQVVARGMIPQFLAQKRSQPRTAARMGAGEQRRKVAPSREQ